jgi:predicted dehydrogenase/RimJ/RimL family protein N-acetyltransferase
VRVAVLGQGSIGRRHAAILRELGHEVVAYDPREEAPAVEGVERALSEPAALDGAVGAIVASPPREHLHQARLALDHGAHVLVEKPFAPSVDGVAALGALARERSLVLGVAMNMRFHPGVATVHRLVTEGAIGAPLRASVWCGSWLPGWREGVDYRDTYSAKRDLGGGVLLDAIHELDYAIWTLGPVRRVQGVLAHVSSLELDVEDVAALTLEHAAGTVTGVTLDYLDRSYHRGCRILGEEGTVEWRWSEETVVRSSAEGVVERVAAPHDVESTYRSEIECFLDAAINDRPPATGAVEAASVLAVVDAARRASESGTTIDLSPPRLALRAATTEDAERLLGWRNDPATRAASFNEAEVSSGEHRAWLARTLADPDRRLFVATANGVPVGQLRLDRLSGGDVEVHIALAHEARGRGLAAPLLELVVRERAAVLGGTRVFARVKRGNEPSRRAFLRAGFRSCEAGSPESRFELLLPDDRE